MKPIKQLILSYIPVIHAGYLEFFAKYPQAEIWVVDKEILKSEFRSLQKDIRALETGQIVESLRALLPERKVKLVEDERELDELGDEIEVIMSEDEVSEWLKNEFLGQRAVTTDTIFLRWSEAKVKQQQDMMPNKVVTSEDLHRVLMGRVETEMKKSSDWWRQTAAAVAKEGELIAIAHNTHKPSDQNPYIFGDPRANSSRGLAMEVSTAMHAEEAVVAAAARQGVSLEGADLYVTTFPCPYCARLVAYSGIKRVFYREGYSVLDGAELMRGQGVELIKVQN
jgi:dCMP deaminase